MSRKHSEIEDSPMAEDNVNPISPLANNPWENHEPTRHTYPPNPNAHSCTNFSYPPPQASLPNSSQRQVVTRSHPLQPPLPQAQSSQRRRQEDGEDGEDGEEGHARLKVYYVPAPERKEFDEVKVSYQEEKAARMGLEKQLQAVQMQLDTMRNQSEARVEDMRRESEAHMERMRRDADCVIQDMRTRYDEELHTTRREAHETVVAWQDWAQRRGPAVEEDDNMEGADAPSAAVQVNEADKRAAEAEKTIHEQSLHIAALMSKLQTRSGHDRPEPCFPRDQPQMIPQFVTRGQREQRRLEVIKHAPRPLPTTSLRPILEAQTSGESDEENSSTRDGENARLTVLVTQIVEDVMDRMGYKAKPDKSTGARQRRAPTPRAVAIKLQQGKMSADDDKLFKRAIRAVWHKKYDVNRAKDFAKYRPASKGLVERCDEGIEEPDDDNFTLDFGTKYASCLWNEIIIQKLATFVKAAQNASPDGWGLPAVSDDYIEGEFHNQLKQAQEAWKLWKPRLVAGTLSNESPAQVAARVTSMELKRRKKGNKNSNKQRKFDRHLKCVRILIELYGEDHPEYATWRYLESLLELLQKDGMSSEEEDTYDVGPTVVEVFKVKTCSWRAARIADYMDIIDRGHDDIKTGRGTRLTPRIRSGEEGSSEARVGLPKQMYDATWLAAQERTRPSYVKRQLKVSDKAFRFLATDKGKGKARDEDDDV
ncbi:hypothetical protein C8R47DRAFT_1206875 [Mycena vitilis]|nr:hypothetical protein C8R47DRAFT_1206875 [Mycena vitilis]